MKRKLYALLAALGLFSLALPATGQNNLLWEVTGNGIRKPTYIFGTYHLMDSSFVDAHPTLRTYLKKCKVVVGELVMDPAAMMGVAAAARMRDTTLQDLLTPEQYERVNVKFKELVGMDVSLYSSFRPTLVTQQISLAMMKKALNRSLDNPAASLDGYFQELGKRRRMEVRGLENMQDQINALFFSTTVQRQAEKLMEALDKLDSLMIQARVLDSCYVAQDLECLHGLLAESGMESSETDALLKNRNHAWMERLKVWMREKPLFVAVGALHLPGPDGLIQLLRQAGYTVRPVNI